MFKRKQKFNYSYRQEKKVVYTYFLIVLLSLLYFLQVTFFPEYLIDFFTLNTTDIFEGNFITVFTALFFHVNTVHLLGNLVAIWIFGGIVEKQLGYKVLLFFVIGGVFANVVSSSIAFYLGDYYSSLGASSGIASLIILSILLHPFAFNRVLIIPIPVALLGWALIFLDITSLNLESDVNHMAHLGGYMSLIILYFFLERDHKAQLKKGLVVNMVGVVVLYLIIRSLRSF